MNTVTSKLSVSSENYYIVTLVPNSDLTQVMTLKKKVKAELLRLIGYKEKVSYGEL